ncbi:hypothetical protein OH710_20710 [Pseudomonas capsici]|uniref:hypothetical protein n=1 Tax=Pseudomonas capsici TaxID=2810614 RepID=UPI0021F15262|nr:hypothetical protein [Pseudomonas capsici]MCV4275067.1 hypothetical protein [Pseudomonas capsici]
MSSELMTTAVCWELGGNVSVEYAKENADLYYFCPEPNCLEKVVPAQRNNKFFRAPDRHVTLCKNAKESTESFGGQGEQKKVAMAISPTVIPSHLGAVPATKKKAMPTRAQMLALAQQVRSSPAIHPGTLQEVVDAWRRLSEDKQKAHQLYVENHLTNYFKSFISLSHARDDINSVNWNKAIVFGDATVEWFNGSFYIKTFSKLTSGADRARIRVRVRSGDPYFKLLKDGQEVKLFLRTPTPTIDIRNKFFEIQPSTLYSGFAIG